MLGAILETNNLIGAIILFIKFTYLQKFHSDSDNIYAVIVSFITLDAILLL